MSGGETVRWTCVAWLCVYGIGHLLFALLEAAWKSYVSKRKR